MTTRQPARPVTAGWPVDERSVLGSVLGLPGYAAIGIALGFTALGVFIDLNRISGLGAIFKGCYFAGCLLAVCWVKRRALFGPVVQPPLLLAIAVPSVVLISGAGSSGAGGLTDHLLSIGAPLLNSFPTMAVTTGFAVAVGLGRYAVQRPGAAEPPARRPASRPTGTAARGARGGGPARTGTSARGGTAARGGSSARTPAAARSGSRRGPAERPPHERAGEQTALGRASGGRGSADRMPPHVRGDRRQPPERRVPPGLQLPPERVRPDRMLPDRRGVDRTEPPGADRRQPPERRAGRPSTRGGRS